MRVVRRSAVAGLALSCLLALGVVASTQRASAGSSALTDICFEPLLITVSVLSRGTWT